MTERRELYRSPPTGDSGTWAASRQTVTPLSLTSLFRPLEEDCRHLERTFNLADYVKFEGRDV